MKSDHSNFRWGLTEIPNTGFAPRAAMNSIFHGLGIKTHECEQLAHLTKLGDSYLLQFSIFTKWKLSHKLLI